MAAAIPSVDRSGVVARLRRAGCVFAEEEAALISSAASTPEQLAALVEARTTGVPIEHLLGWAEFCGLRIAVDAGVFVPRRRTELLVRQAAALAPRHPVVVDLCCGSGAVGAAVCCRLDGVELHAVDIDLAAVRCARRNLAAVRGRVYLGDGYQPLPPALRGHVDVVVANAPYVPTDAVALLPQEARLHEPRRAVDGGVDGLQVLQRVVVPAAGWLAPGGHLLVETSAQQAPAVADLAARNGLTSRVVRCDDLDATVVVATKVERLSGTPPHGAAAATRTPSPRAGPSPAAS